MGRELVAERTTTTIDGFSSEPHYGSHLAPILVALHRRGITFESKHHGPIMVAGFKDLSRVGRRPAILVEHGAGQTYTPGRNGAYAGGAGRERVALFICPSERVARLNQLRYPNARVAIVGCPRMDELHRERPVPVARTIGVAFHWQGPVCPETKTAWPHFSDAISNLTKTHNVIGTAHPRIWQRIGPWYAKHGITPVQDSEEVLRRAHVLIADNTSLGWEHLSMDKPVVWLNPPWYRKHVEHGLRFWEYADAGVQCDEPASLLEAVEEALADSEPQRLRRRSVVPLVYAYTDGKASERAADAIEELLKGA